MLVFLLVCSFFFTRNLDSSADESIGSTGTQQRSDPTSISILHNPTPNCTSSACSPNFIILGVAKCGTSSLYKYLTSHPSSLPAEEKQIQYFKYYIDRGFSWYQKQFPVPNSFYDDVVNKPFITGEASPGYIPYPEVASRIFQAFGSSGVKLIVVLRDPYERAYSSYL